MTRYAIGDVQGCHAELRALVRELKFSPDRDVLWFVGDLVNRGPQSLETLRYIHSLGDNAVVVLGNHDLHLLAVVYGSKRKRKSGDTIDDVLEAPDRDKLLEWLITRPLVHFDADQADLMVHGGVIPRWTLKQTLDVAREVESALRTNPRELFDNMYGDQPDRWSENLTGYDRLRFAINVLTRMRFCTADGRIDLKMKGPPTAARAPFKPWFEHENRLTQDVRILFGHWSALGFSRSHNTVGLDTGCVWGGSLSAFNLDADAPLISVPCAGYQEIGSES